MTPEQKKLVQTSFVEIRRIADTTAALFYGRLFTLDPKLERLFKGDLEEQGRKLLHVIGLAVKGLNRRNELMPLLRDLGARHAGYGVTGRDYGTVRTALMWTLEQGLGGAFTAELRDAWIAVYELFATTMQAGARETLVATATGCQVATYTGGDRKPRHRHLRASARKTLKRRETEMKSEDNYETLTGRFATTFGTIAMLICILFFAGVAASAKTITVTGTGDTIAVDGLVTLREAITAANTNATSGDAPAGDPGLDLIYFNIAGSGIHTIHPTSALPPITEKLLIAGYAQPGTSVNTLAVGDNRVLLIELDGTNSGPAASGLTVAAPECYISGLVINRFADSQIQVLGPAGHHAKIYGNFIGTDATGTSGWNAGKRGVYISAAEHAEIGGLSSQERNVIGGMGGCFPCAGSAGIFVDGSQGSVAGTNITGNYIGTDKTGGKALPNNYWGVELYKATDVNVGGSFVGERNVLSGNTQQGLKIVSSSNCIVQNNFIGVDAAGVKPLGNGGIGFDLENSISIKIGGDQPGEGNVISGNVEYGLRIGNSSGQVVQGNFIGTDLSRTISLGNGEDGVAISPLTTSNQIGGTLTGAGNTIAFNHGSGIGIYGSNVFPSGNAISGNSIYQNGRLGIDLGLNDGPNDVTPNDPGDSDGGPNHLQNYPVLATANSVGGLTSITGTLASAPNTKFRVEFFLSPAADPSGFGEGQNFLLSKDVTTDGSGNVSFSASIFGFHAGQALSATATDLQGNTSEFSHSLLVTGPAPNVTINDPSITEGDVFHPQQLTFTVNLSTVKAQDVKVNYTTADGTAISPDDYSTISGVLTIPAGSTSGQIVVPILGETMFELNETLSVNLSNPVGAVITKAQGIGTIQNDDSQPTLYVSNTGTNEGDTGTTPIDVSVSLSNRSYQTVTVKYATADGTAKSGSDYLPISGTLTFNPGEQTKQVVAELIGDTIEEPAEVFFLNLSDPINATILKGQGVFEIIGNDYPTLSVSSVTLAEGQSGTTDFVFNVMLSKPGITLVTVDYGTIDGSASAGSDYQPVMGTLIFAVGETNKVVTVPVNGEKQDEPDETFLLNLSNFSNSTLAQGTGTIVNDDAPAAAPMLQFSASNYSVQEDLGALTITVTRSGDSSGSASVNYSTHDATATQKGDFEWALGTLSFAPGDTTRTFQVLINEDNYVEGNETLTLSLSNPTGASLGQQSTATVTIDDDALESLTNPIDDPQSFVYMQYHDFLGREPDSTGLQNWVNTLAGCPNGGFGEFDNPDCDRVHVSAGFYLSEEFRGRGYWAYRFYQTSFGRAPLYTEFVPDMLKVGGPQSPGQEVVNKQAFTDEWVKQPAFKAKYDPLINPMDYVNELMSTTGVNLPNRDALVNSLQNNQKTRAQVLREIVESKQVEDKFFIPAFVSLQYFGYLRRDPDPIGYNNWVIALTNDPGNYRHMIFGFIYSTEYRQRFGQ